MLLNIPNDIFVKLLHVLEVQDILLVESTCRNLRQCIMHDARHLWLTKFNDLGPSCAPDMPHNIPVESLTCEELRSIVIKAVRQYWAVMKPTPSKPIFYLKNRIPLDCPYTGTDFSGQFQSRIILEGRYLFIYWNFFSRVDFSWSQDFYIVDTKDSNRRVWSYGRDNSQDGKTILDAYEFKARRDGTIILVTFYRVAGVGTNAIMKAFFRVLGLYLESESGTFREALVYSMQCSSPYHTDLAAQTHYPISDDFVLLLDPGINLILALKWDDKKVAKVRTTRFTTLRCFRIWEGHLFYMDIERKELRAVPLSQLFDRQLNDGSLVELDHISYSTLNIHELKDQFGNNPVAYSPRGIMYSIYDTPWKKDSTAVFTITLQPVMREPVFTFIRARFSSDDSVNWRWTVLSARTTAADQHPDAFATGILPDMTRSGRMVFYVHVPHQQGFGICAVDRQGDPVISFQPMEINQLLQGSDNNHGQSSNRFRETYIQSGFDEYWGSLRILRRTPSGGYSLEIYYPV